MCKDCFGPDYEGDPDTHDLGDDEALEVERYFTALHNERVYGKLTLAEQIDLGLPVVEPEPTDYELAYVD